MAEQEESITVHEHIEPNIVNILLIAAILILVLYGIRYMSNKYPSAFGGLSLTT